MVMRAEPARRPKSVDPKVYDLAHVWVSDLVQELQIDCTPVARTAMVQRLAEAAQQAFEDEYEALRQEITGP